MTPQETDEISDDCAIAHAGMRTGLRNFTVAFPQAVYGAYIANKRQFLLLIAAAQENQRVGNIRALLGYLNAPIGVETAAQRALALIRWNKVFGLSGLKITDTVVTNATTALTIITEIYDTGQSVSTGFKAYCLAVANSQQAVYTLRQRFILAGLPFGNFYDIIHFFHQNLFDFALLTQNTIVELYRLALAAPPRSGFAGFADWGPGNNGGIEPNKANHFFKHVLNAEPVVLTWTAETAIWWQTLNIAFNRNNARANMPGPAFDLITGQFPANDDSAPMVNGNVVEFLRLMRVNNAWGQAIRDWFGNHYQAGYVAYSLDVGRNLANVNVQTTLGGGLYVSGRRGNFFAIGRRDAGVLGLSACYVAQDINQKLADRVEIWPL